MEIGLSGCFVTTIIIIIKGHVVRANIPKKAGEDLHEIQQEVKTHSSISCTKSL